MRTVNKRQVNSEKLNDLKSVFSKALATQKQSTRREIDEARAINGIPLEEATLEDRDSGMVQNITPASVLAESASIKPTSIHPAAIINEATVLAPSSKALSTELIDTKSKESKVNPRVSIYVTPAESEKIKDLRRYLVQNGINSNITDAQLVRMALQKLEISLDLVPLYERVQADDGRKNR